MAAQMASSVVNQIVPSHFSTTSVAALLDMLPCSHTITLGCATPSRTRLTSTL